MQKETIQNYKELIVWQKSFGLSKKIYLLTEKFPKQEMFGIVSQMRRSAISIPSNIAEGRCRGSRKDFAQFLRIALGSASELETQLMIAKELSFGDKLNYNDVELELGEILKMLRTMISRLCIPKLQALS